MTKRVRKPGTKKAGAKKTIEHRGIRKESHTNSQGIRVLLQGIPPLKQEKVIDSMSLDPEWGPRPTVPKYKMDLAGGAEQWKEHNETTLETEEEKKMWADYKAAEEAWDLELSRRLLHSFIWDGIRMPVPSYWLDENESRFPHVDDPDREEEIYWLYLTEKVIHDGARWIREDEFLKIVVPSDPLERMMYYLETKVMATQDDADNIGAIVRGLTGIDMGSLEAAQNMFQPEMGQKTA